MARIEQLDVDHVTGWRAKLFRRVKDSLGLVPNMFRCMGNSEMALDGFLTLNANLEAGQLDARLRKMVILATSELNGCEYCVAAHTQMAKDAGLLNDNECLSARRLEGTDQKSKALLQFTAKVIANKGKVSDEDIQVLRKHGFKDAEIIETLAVIALSIFSNYVSNVGEPELDFPKAPALT